MRFGTSATQSTSTNECYALTPQISSSLLTFRDRVARIIGFIARAMRYATRYPRERGPLALASNPLLPMVTSSSISANKKKSSVCYSYFFVPKTFSKNISVAP